ncbi:MAG: DUF4864 domain-containing protein [Burkholderiaceae bacterium]
MSNYERKFMVRRFTWQALLVVLAFSMTAAHAIAQESTASTAQAQAITQVVRLQLAAFAEDDAEKAFSLATAETQSLAGTPTELLRVIKRRFAPVYRHRQALFSEPEIIGTHGLQVVQLIDHENLVWIAIYQVEREADGTWKVDGCQLFETKDFST